MIFRLHGSLSPLFSVSVSKKNPKGVSKTVTSKSRKRKNPNRGGAAKSKKVVDDPKYREIK